MLRRRLAGSSSPARFDLGRVDVEKAQPLLAAMQRFIISHMGAGAIHAGDAGI